MFSRRPNLARFAPVALATLSALSLGCAPERVDMNVHDIFTSDAARYALQTKMPPDLLTAVGGFLPTDAWPATAPRLLLDLPIVAQNKIDLSGAGIDTSPYSGLRPHWAQVIVSSPDGTQLTPTPTMIELFVGPSSATSITDTGVSPLASGAYPETMTSTAADCDAGPAGGACAPTDGGWTAAPQTLIFGADAQLALQQYVFAKEPFSIFVVLHLPIDSAVNPAMPLGGADLLFDVQFEMAR
jgi:hypothetical protein